jgi:preprotein translocase subunit YajC
MHRFIILMSGASMLAASEVATERSDPAGTPPPGGAKPPEGLNLPMLLIPALVVAFMWFIMIRPQKKEEKRRKEMVSAIKRGDKVITIGGLHAEVAAVGEGTIDLRVGQGQHETILTFNKGAVSTVADAAAKAN